MLVSEFILCDLIAVKTYLCLAGLCVTNLHFNLPRIHHNFASSDVLLKEFFEEGKVSMLVVVQCNLSLGWILGVHRV